MVLLVLAGWKPNGGRSVHWRIVGAESCDLGHAQPDGLGRFGGRDFLERQECEVHRQASTVLMRKFDR